MADEQSNADLASRGLSSAELSEQMETALRLLHVPHKDWPLARDWIGQVVNKFEHALQRQSDPLLSSMKGLADANREVREIAELAHTLTHKLETSWPQIRGLLGGYGSWGNPLDDRGRKNVAELLSEELALLPALSRFSHVMNMLSERLPTATGRDHDLYTMIEGAPKAHLAYDCWDVFSWFRPGEAKSTEHGMFHKFVESVYIIAIDADDVEGAGLIRYVRNAVKAAKLTPGLEAMRRALGTRACPIGLLGESIAVAVTPPTFPARP